MQKKNFKHDSRTSKSLNFRVVEMWLVYIFSKIIITLLIRILKFYKNRREILYQFLLNLFAILSYYISTYVGKINLFNSSSRKFAHKLYFSSSWKSIEIRKFWIKWSKWHYKIYSTKKKQKSREVIYGEWKWHYSTDLAAFASFVNENRENFEK